jgi:CBS-domain-containing membrane protein
VAISIGCSRTLVDARLAAGQGRGAAGERMGMIERLRGVAAWAGVQPRPAMGRMVHAFIGAVFGIFMTGFVMHRWAAGQPVSVPLLVAPMGASAVLLFGVPASPLAQPWAIIGGNTVSALCGVFGCGCWAIRPMPPAWPWPARS